METKRSTKRRTKQDDDGEDLEEYESDFEQFRFNISSPELSSIYSNVLDAGGGGGGVTTTPSIPKLFSGESLENIHEKSSIPTPSSTSEDTSDKKSPQVDLMGGASCSPLNMVRQPSPLVQSSLGVSHSNGGPSPGSGHVDSPDSQLLMNEAQTGNQWAGPTTVKRPAANVNWNEILLKKQRLEDALTHITARQIQVKANLQRLSSQPSSFLPLPTPNPVIVVSGGGGGGVPLVKQETTPYATPHETPHVTPVPSPLPPSPHMSSYPPLPPPPVHPQQHHYSHPPTPLPHPLEPHPLSQPGTPLNSLPTSPIGFKPIATPTNSHAYYYQPNTYPHSYPVSPVGGCGLFSQPVPPISLINGTNPYGALQYNGMGVVGGGASMPGSTVTSPINRVS